MSNLTSKQIVINTLRNILYKFENEDNNNIWKYDEKLKTIAFVFDLISSNSENNTPIIDKQLEYITLGWYISNISNNLK